MLLTGTTTVEAKSGYGLNFEDEIKQLEALAALRGAHPVDVVPTYMGAHEIPPEFKGRKAEYIDLIIDRVLPEVKARGLAEFFDIFCEPNVFDLEDTKRLAEAARAAGLGVKIHADEFVPIGGDRVRGRVGRGVGRAPDLRDGGRHPEDRRQAGRRPSSSRASRSS